MQTTDNALLGIEKTGVNQAIANIHLVEQDLEASILAAGTSIDVPLRGKLDLTSLVDASIFVKTLVFPQFLSEFEEGWLVVAVCDAADAFENTNGGPREITSADQAHEIRDNLRLLLSCIRSVDHEDLAH